MTVKNALSSGYSGGSGVVGFDASSAFTAALLNESISDGRTTVTSVKVGGADGYWISGAPHDIILVDPSGEPVFDSRRSAGDTLIWSVGDLTSRLESALGRGDAIALAESLR